MNPAEQQLAAIEAVSGLCGFLDSVKTDLEERGWQPTLASQAAIQVGGPILIAAQASGGKS